MAENIIAGLDIGSHAIRVAVGQSMPGENDKEQVHIIGAVEMPSEGVNKGTITSIEDATASTSKALEMAERLTGFPVNTAWVGISGSHIITEESKGVIGVARSDGEIKEEDVERAIEAARTVATPANYEILHVIPKSFTVDGQRGIKDPVGMNGIRLEVDALIIQGLTTQIKNLTKCVYRTGLEIDDLVFSVLASAEAVVSNRQKELGVAVVNIGSSTTSVVVYEEGDVLHTAVIPVGAGHITSDIAIGLRTSIDVAEEVKLRHAVALPSEVSRKEDIYLEEFGGSEGEKTSAKFVSEIAEARIEEIYEKVDQELAKIDRSGMLPAGVVLTGGGSKMPSMIDVAKRQLRLPAELGTPIGITSVVDYANDPAFSTSIGLVVWGHSISGVRGGGLGNLFGKIKVVNQLGLGLVKLIKSLKP